MKIIDPHIHLFDLCQGDYQWLKPENPPYWPDKNLINRDFSEQDLFIDSPNQISGVVHIEAGFDNAQPHREIQWLSETLNLPFRAIAYIDIKLSATDFLTALNKLLTYKAVVGVRYILDDQAPALLQNPQVVANLTTLAEYHLLFEAQLRLTQPDVLVPFIKILKIKNSQGEPLKVIINHAGTVGALATDLTNKAWITTWHKALKALSPFAHCGIKCSGWELTDRQYQQSAQFEMVNYCLSSLGEDRVMLASNFPLVLFSQSYDDYWKRIVANSLWSDALKHKIFYQNSANWYGFKSVT